MGFRNRFILLGARQRRLRACLRLLLTLFFCFFLCIFSFVPFRVETVKPKKYLKKVDSNRGAQHRIARSADLLQDVLLFLREAQGPTPPSENPISGRGKRKRARQESLQASDTEREKSRVLISRPVGRQGLPCRGNTLFF